MSGRLVLWALELTQFDIKYKARTTIKAQVLANFIAEFSTIPDPDVPMSLDPNPANPEWSDECKTWVLYIDRASNQSGCGAGIILTDPEGVECSHYFRFEFRATNNEAEYEALLAGMGVTEALKVDFFPS